MRTILWLSLLLIGCGSSGLSSNGDLASSTRQDLAGRDLVSMPPGDLSGYDLTSHPVDLAGADLSGVDLARVCFNGECTQPNCGTNCCAAGEWCDSGVCRCGDGNACTGGNICQSSLVVDGNGCGTICCGKTSACPG